MYTTLFTTGVASIPYSISPLETKPCSHVLHGSPPPVLAQFTPLCRSILLFLHGRRPLSNNYHRAKKTGRLRYYSTFTLVGQLRIHDDRVEGWDNLLFVYGSVMRRKRQLRPLSHRPLYKTKELTEYCTSKLLEITGKFYRDSTCSLHICSLL